MDNEMIEVTPNPKPVPGQSHNLLGQRLGRKGRDTQARILAAVHRLLTQPSDAPLSLSAVANEAAVGLTTLYLYFADMGELLLAALEPIVVGGHAMLERFAHRWPDAKLEQECLHFLEAHHAFWATHSRILHIRNNFADTGDQRLLVSRRVMSSPAITLVARQMLPAGRTDADLPDCYAFAAALLTMLERMATITTDETMREPRRGLEWPGERFVHDVILAEARIMALTVRDRRASKRAR